MIAPKYLIVNADDFGQSVGVTHGVIEAHEQGIVTSASLMVRWRSAIEAGSYARAHPEFAVGLHLDFGEWRLNGNEWVSLYEVVDMTDAVQVRRQALWQLQRFRDVVGGEPTHLDSHQHVHLNEPLKSVASDMAAELKVPLRHFAPEVTYCGSFYGQSNEGELCHERIRVDGLIGIIRSLAPGITELGCHPGYVDDLETMYRHERLLEMRSLCDPRLRLVLSESEVRITSFKELALTS